MKKEVIMPKIGLDMEEGNGQYMDQKKLETMLR